MIYQTCVNCIMDTTDPNITFDKKGICNHCHSAWRMEAERQIERKNFKKVIETLKKQKGKYHCLIGLSGGIDSSLALYYLVQNGIKPLTFSVDNGWNSPEADENIMRMVEGLKVPFYRYNINIEAFRELQQAFLDAGLPNAEIPTDHILMATSYEMAAKNDIKYIISGGNVATESIMPPAWSYNARDLVHIKDVYSKQTGEVLGDSLPVCSLAKFNYYRWIKRIKIIYLLDYYDYNREQAKQKLNFLYGWKDYGEKHCESMFTKWFQNYYLYQVHKIDKRRAHYSSLICSGQMTRNEAVKHLQDDKLDYPDLKLRHGQRSSHDDYKKDEKLFNAISKIIRTLRLNKI